MKKLYIGWQDIDWTLVYSRVFKWQQEIFFASKIGDIKTLRKYQHKILRSLDAKLLVVKRITQEIHRIPRLSNGKVMTITINQKLALARSLTIPVRESFLHGLLMTKLEKSEKSLVHLRSIQDSCLQLLFKLALEPEWEVKFEENLYGFRSGRNCHDAFAAIRFFLQKSPKYLLSAKIVNYFEKVNHEKLLEKIGMSGKYRYQLKNWLKNGVLVNKDFRNRNTLIGVISSLLTNIVLHGIEKFCRSLIIDFSDSECLRFVRYADNFVVMHHDLMVIKLLHDKLPEFLVGVGLDFNSTNIRISHTLEIIEANQTISPGLSTKPGFDFLGFYIRQYRTRHLSSDKEKRGFRTTIIPSKKIQNAYQAKLHYLVLALGKRMSQDVLLKKLNYIIWGWSKYFGKSNGNVIRLLGQMDYLLYLKLRKWSKRIYKTISKGKVAFRKIGSNNWIFATETLLLLKHIDYSQSINFYVKWSFSPYNYKYSEIPWFNLLSANSTSTTRKNNTIQEKKGFCKCCNESLSYEIIVSTSRISSKFEE